MTLLESTTLRTPVVAHKVGGVSEAMAGEYGGLLIGEHTAEAYAKGTLILLKETAITQRILAKGFERIKERYAACKNAERVNTLYHNATARIER